MCVCACVCTLGLIDRLPCLLSSLFLSLSLFLSFSLSLSLSLFLSFSLSLFLSLSFSLSLSLSLSFSLSLSLPLPFTLTPFFSRSLSLTSHHVFSSSCLSIETSDCGRILILRWNADYDHRLVCIVRLYMCVVKQGRRKANNINAVPISVLKYFLDKLFLYNLYINVGGVLSWVRTCMCCSWQATAHSLADSCIFLTVSWLYLDFSSHGRVCACTAGSEYEFFSDLEVTEDCRLLVVESELGVGSMPAER